MKQNLARAGIPTLVLIGVFVTPMLLPVFPQHASRTLKAWWDFAHTPAFALFTLGLSYIAQRHYNRPRILWLAWTAALLLVPGIEYLQGFVGRERSVVDLVYGVTGCVIGGLLFVGRYRGPRPVTSRFAMILFLASLGYPALLWVDDWRVSRMFPVISAFDSPLEASRWRIIGCDIVRNEGWDITIRENVPRAAILLGDMEKDWSSAHGLALDMIVNGDESSEICLVIDDSFGILNYSNRFQQVVTVVPGTNTIRIYRPALGRSNGGRLMDMSNIRGLGIYFDAKHGGRTFHMDKVYLVNDGSDVER